MAAVITCLAPKSRPKVGQAILPAGAFPGGLFTQAPDRYLP
jgi:hypothetical protein